MTAIEQLKERLHKIACLKEIGELLSWDQEVMMPEDSGEARAEQTAAVADCCHELSVAPELGRLIDEAQKELEAAGDHESAEFHIWRKARTEYERNTKVPQKLAKELSLAQALARDQWMKARKADDFSIFCDSLKRVLELSRQEAECYAPHGNLYDALLDKYEPGLKSADTARIFDDLRGDLVTLVQEIGAQPQVDDASVTCKYPIPRQRQFLNRIITDMGYDWKRGRIDDVIHPFCCSFSTRDVRITSCFKEDEITKGLFGGIHETGHAIYEQASPAEWAHSPIEGGASMGTHESQSRLWENIIGRSRAFWEFYYPELQKVFPENLQNCSLDSFYKAINKVEPSFVRTEADEVTYCLHIMLRFELEQKMLTGHLKVEDLPEAFNEGMRNYLGIVPPSAALGCLQDVHWSLGYIGYFPAYALGNMIGAQIWETLNADLGNADDFLRHGDLTSIRHWLTEKMYRHGARYLPNELMVKITGRPLEAAPFKRYLRNKYSEIYGF